jgi:hypothetical protein
MSKMKWSTELRRMIKIAQDTGHTVIQIEFFDPVGNKIVIITGNGATTARVETSEDLRKLV